MSLAAISGAEQLARHEWWALLEAATGRPREYFIAHPDATLNAQELALLQKWVSLRLAGRPLAYLVGWREFYGRRFWVNPCTLIPRADTELLVDLAKDLLRKTGSDNATAAGSDKKIKAGSNESVDVPSHKTIIDLGTGCGAIAVSLALECRDTRVIATDISAQALTVARNNAAWLGLKVAEDASDWLAADTKSQILFAQGSWWGALRSGLSNLKVSGIISNPPYIAKDDPHLGAGDLLHEPQEALCGAPPSGDGLAAYHALLAGISGRIEPGGFVLVEHGHEQQDAVIGLFEQYGLCRVKGYADAAGRPRAVLGFQD